VTGHSPYLTGVNLRLPDDTRGTSTLTMSSVAAMAYTASVKKTKRSNSMPRHDHRSTTGTKPILDQHDVE
jgi:hypothetical protein